MATSNPTRAAAVLLGVEVINGYVVIAERRIEGTRQGRVILGARRALNGFDYVTAVAPTADQRPTEWAWGHYFDMRQQGIGVDNFAEAVEDFNDR